MRIHRSVLALLGLALLTIAACNSAAPGAPGATAVTQGGAAVAAASVKGVIEAATHVTLVEQPGQNSSGTVYVNTTTMGTDLQFVALFVGNDAASVKIVADAMRSGFAQLGQMKTYSNKNVIVFYIAMSSTDNSGAVDAAVKGL